MGQKPFSFFFGGGGWLIFLINLSGSNNGIWMGALGRLSDLTLSKKSPTHRTHERTDPEKNLGIDHNSIATYLVRGLLGFGPIQFLMDTRT